MYYVHVYGCKSRSGCLLRAYLEASISSDMPRFPDRTSRCCKVGPLSGVLPRSCSRRGLSCLRILMSMSTPIPRIPDSMGLTTGLIGFLRYSGKKVGT